MGLLRTCKREHPTAKEVALADWWALTCQPCTGTVPPTYRARVVKCQEGRGATLSTMDRVGARRRWGHGTMGHGTMGKPWADHGQPRETRT